MDIVHDIENKKFYCIVEGKECFVQYAIEGDTIDFLHTYTPLSLRGQGIARKIYDRISEWLGEQEKAGLKLAIKTSCSYAERYFSGKK